MIYGICLYCGHVTAIKKWANRTPARTIAKWAEYRSGSKFQDDNTARTLHYTPRGWKGPDLTALSLEESAREIKKICLSADKEAEE